MYLYINTASHQNIEVSIIDSKLKMRDLVRFSFQYQFQIKDKLLKGIDKILVKNRIVLNNLDGIIAVNKSKEMMSLRIGISAVNALAYGLNISAIGIENPNQLLSAIKNFKIIKKFKPLKPRYEINPMLKD